MKESNWYGIDVCVKCEGRLSKSEMLYRDGVCPKCGNIAKFNSSICDTKKVVLKKITHHKWWEFWNQKYTYVGIDDFSNRWVNER